MSTEQLRNLLSDIADDVEPASMHQRAAAKSRRIATGRATLAAIVTLGVASGAIFGVNAFAAGEGTPAASGGKLDGELVFTASDGKETKVWSWKIGDEPEELVTGLNAISNSLTLSPDGKYLAYGEGTYDGGQTDATKVHVVDLETGKDVPLPDSIPGIADVPGTDGKKWDEKPAFPSWAPDSQRLWVNAGAEHADGEYGFVDVESGKFTESQRPAGDGTPTVVSDPEGKDLLVSDLGKGKYAAVDPEGNKTVHEVEREGDFGKPESDMGEGMEPPVCETAMSAGTCQIQVHDDESKAGFSLIFQDQVSTAVSEHTVEEAHDSTPIGNEHYVNIFDKRANLTVKDKKGEVARELDSVDLPKQVLSGDDRDFGGLIYRQ